jgi:hypothetical protein
MRSLRPIRDILARMRHDGCGGRAGKAELQQPAGAEDRAAAGVRAFCGSDKERAAAGWGFQATARVQFRVTKRT